MRLLLVLPFILIGCAPQQDIDPGVISGIDPAFNSYYAAFDTVYGTKVSIAIGFAALPQPIAGQCMKYGDGWRQIEIDPTYWASVDDDTRMVLVFHELGHCVFNRLHNWDTMSDGCPLSIMQTDNFGDPCYAMHQADYLAELPHSEAGDHL